MILGIVLIMLGIVAFAYLMRKDMTVKGATILGIALILLGVVAFAYQGITYTTRVEMIDIGLLQAPVNRGQIIPLPLLVGVFALISGIVLLIGRTRRG
jgi:uncharacterized membrane protein HdeD (DUF308 family)